MQSCWLADPTERPSFTRVKEVILKELELDVEEGRSLKDYLSLLELEPGKMTYNSIRASNYQASHDNDEPMVRKMRAVKRPEENNEDESFEEDMDDNDTMHQIPKKYLRVNSIAYESSLPFIDEDIDSSNDGS